VRGHGISGLRQWGNAKSSLRPAGPARSPLKSCPSLSFNASRLRRPIHVKTIKCHLISTPCQPVSHNTRLSGQAFFGKSVVACVPLSGDDNAHNPPWGPMEQFARPQILDPRSTRSRPCRGSASRRLGVTRPPPPLAPTGTNSGDKRDGRKPPRRPRTRSWTLRLAGRTLVDWPPVVDHSIQGTSTRLISSLLMHHPETVTIISD
jgi:hypothetical protein